MELNAEQRRAVDAVRGPVSILAGAGTGKTTTIAHRIANQVATGTFRPDEILAVTFTDKAAGEMRGRLIRAPRGEGGFGYDPIFVPEGYDVTSAELPAEEKDAISHRGRALRALVPVLREHGLV